jgi:aspartyl protease family protein
MPALKRPRIACMLTSPNRRTVIAQTIAALLIVSTVSTAYAQAIDLQGILPGGKAVVSVAGGAPKIVQSGALVDGAKIITVEANSILVEAAGKKFRIELGAGPMRLPAASTGSSDGSGAGRVVLTADSRGHYVTTGFVNNKPQQFLVDTGASIVALSKADALRLGLNLANGRTVQANTANGRAYGTAIRIDSLRIGEITVNNVETWVLDDLAGPALLGMTFLSRTAMQQEGGSLTLVKRY